MGRVSFDNGKTFKEAEELTKKDIEMFWKLKSTLSEELKTELKSCGEAAKIWFGPLKGGEDVYLRKAIELLKNDCIFDDYAFNNSQIVMSVISSDPGTMYVINRDVPYDMVITV